jgi:hypothetical protein
MKKPRSDFMKKMALRKSGGKRGFLQPRFSEREKSKNNIVQLIPYSHLLSGIADHQNSA